MADGVQNANRQISALVEYRDGNTGEQDAQDYRTSWDTGSHAAGPRSWEDDERSARPSYSDRAYPNHGYWENDQQAQQQAPERQLTPVARTDAWPSPVPSSSNRRFELSPVAPVAPSITPAGFGFDGDDRDYPAVVWWTVIWYAIPVVLYTLWALVMSSSGMRGHALHGLLTDAFPGLFAVALSLGFAVWIRRVSLAWRAITLGFGAACVGAGLATLLVSAL